MPGLFSFDPRAGETPEMLKRRRQVAEALLGGGGAPPQTIGGGLSSLGSSIASALLQKSYDRQEQAGLAGAAGTFGELLGGFGGTAVPAAPATDVVSGGGGTDVLSGRGGDFVTTMTPYAKSVAARTGIDPNLILAQTALETGWGKSVAGNNYFGIKGEGTVTPTKEFVNGQPVATSASFRAYDNPEASFNDYADFIGGDRYAGVRSAKTLEDQARALQAAGYATDPEYANKLISIANRLRGGKGGGAPAVTSALVDEASGSDTMMGNPRADTLGGDPAFDFSRFATGGAAARPDSFTGLQPEMSSNLGAMISSAPPSIQNELRVMSGFRSEQVQEQLWQNALKKYGSASAARKWVAPPGRSQHGFGNAIDWKFASKEARAWAHANAGKFGFAFPLANEPWHMEVAGARGGGGRNVPQPSASGIGRQLDSTGGGAGGVGVPAVTEALLGAVPQQQQQQEEPVAGTSLDVLTNALGYDPTIKDDALAPAFRPAGGTTPYNAGATVLGGGSANTGIPAYDPLSSANVGAPSPPLPPMRPADAPVAPIAPVPPVAPAGVAPVAAALGVDPLPQTSGLMGPVAAAGHESLAPGGAAAVTDALGGGAGADRLAGGGGGILRRLFGPRPTGATPAAPAAPGAVPGAPAAAPGETAALPGTEPVSGVPEGGGGFTPIAQAAIKVLQNPWSNPGQQAIAKTILDQEIAKADPKYRIDLERARVELEQAKTPTRAMTEEEKRAAGIDPSINARIDAKGNVTEGPKIEPKIINNRAYHPVTGEELWRAPPGTKILTREEAIDSRLDPDLGTWTVDADGKPSIIEGTEPEGLINVGGGVLYDPNKKEWLKPPENFAPRDVKLSDEASLRKEVAGLPGHERYAFSQPVMSGMIASIYDNTAMSDMQFVYGMAQIFDPTSVVRKEEGQYVVEGQSLPEQLGGQLAKILNGEASLGLQLRRDLVETTLERVRQYKIQADAEASAYTDIAKRYEMDEENIIIPLPDLPTAPPQAPPDAVKLLASNPTPEQKKLFDAAFGPGAAEAYLADLAAQSP